MSTIADMVEHAIAEGRKSRQETKTASADEAATLSPTAMRIKEAAQAIRDGQTDVSVNDVLALLESIHGQ